jgi:hypothetical protein
MDKVRLMRRDHRMHPTLLRQVVSLSSIAGTTGGHHVGPVVITAAGEWNQVVPRQALTVPEIGLSPVAVLAPIAISSKEECIGDLAAEAAGYVDELDEPNNCRFGKGQSFTSNDVPIIRFDNLRLAFDDQAESTPYRDHRQRFEGGVQRQTPHCAVS